MDAAVKAKPGVNSRAVEQIKRFVEAATYNPATDNFELDDRTVAAELVLHLFDEVDIPKGDHNAETESGD